MIVKLVSTTGWFRKNVSEKKNISWTHEKGQPWHMNTNFFIPAAIRLILKFCFCDQLGKMIFPCHLAASFFLYSNSFQFQISDKFERDNNPSSKTMRLSIYFDWYVHLKIKYYLLEALQLFCELQNLFWPSTDAHSP